MDKYIIKSKYCWDGQSSEVNSDVALYISDGRIAEIGKSNEILNKYNNLPVIGGDDILLLPPLLMRMTMVEEYLLLLLMPLIELLRCGSRI